jgi:signal peptidase I
MFDYSRIPRRHQTLILACMLFWSLLSYMAVRRFVLEGSRVEGRSMEPTLHEGDRFVLSRLSYHVRSPKRGDIVAISLHAGESLSVKRIIGLPLERIAIRGGRVHINGRELPEPYLPEPRATAPGALGEREYEIAANCYFVMGDNRANSLDSRNVGALSRDRIEGVILLWDLN